MSCGPLYTIIRFGMASRLLQGRHLHSLVAGLPRMGPPCGAPGTSSFSSSRSPPPVRRTFPPGRAAGRVGGPASENEWHACRFARRRLGRRSRSSDGTRRRLAFLSRSESVLGLWPSPAKASSGCVPTGWMEGSSVLVSNTLRLGAGVDTRRQAEECIDVAFSFPLSAVVFGGGTLLRTGGRLGRRGRRAGGVVVPLGQPNAGKGRPRHTAAGMTTARRTPGPEPQCLRSCRPRSPT
jgi:hypothetical protein